ncbi:MAG: flagellar type III secretion system pore protein FliP [Phycisphaerae bacterium]|nr:flagellar type III secretion system pore protein FliP [Phycisphaerae bacterium]
MKKAIVSILTFVLTASTSLAADIMNAPSIDSLNPIGVLQDVAKSVPGLQGGLSSQLNIILLLTVLAIAPGILILCTCFTRIVIVLSLLRQALGTQGLPPTQVVVGLSMFLSAVVMAPTFESMWKDGLGPYARGEQPDQIVAWERTKQPLRSFMIDQIEKAGNTSAVFMLLDARGVDVSEPERLSWDRDVDMITLVPSFVLSELKASFLIGFRIWLPFLVIDMVISSLLISMGMMMLPPVLVSMPFKLLLFVMVDGWQLVAGSLMAGFSRGHEVVAADSVTSVIVSFGGLPPFV